MGQCAGVGEVIDRDDIDVLVGHRHAHDVAPDSAETIDADPDRHGTP